jgi:hypothetical protein
MNITHCWIILKNSKKESRILVKIFILNISIFFYIRYIFYVFIYKNNIKIYKIRFTDI